MKKIICAFIAMAMAVAANAAAMTWSTSTAMYCGNTTDTFAGTMYLIDAANISQADLETALKGGADISTYAVASATATAGKIAATTLDPVKKAGGSTSYEAGSYNFYTAAIVDGKLFASASKAVSLADVGEAKASFSLKTASQNADNFKPVGGDSGTPEPTSGLLLLVGGAMLALRRKQK